MAEESTTEVKYHLILNLQNQNIMIEVPSNCKSGQIRGFRKCIKTNTQNQIH